MGTKVICPACGSQAEQYNYGDGFVFFDCPVCGRFELSDPEENCMLDRNHLASYLVYHCYQYTNANGKSEYRYNTVRDKAWCDRYRKEFEQGNNCYGRPVHMDADMVENWYPKTFAERVDRILLYLAAHTEHIGQTLILAENHAWSVLFIDRQYQDDRMYSPTQGQWLERNCNECADEAGYMLHFLQDKKYIKYTRYTGSGFHILLTPDGYARVDELQKNTSQGRQVLVAMKFGDDTIPLREAIRKGVADAGYIAIFIDEVQHNDFITPELLKHIKDSKFVVADLTHQNNGAYFEEGYAMGLGKPVIQLCKKDVQLHFDIAQKNTIIWKAEDEIPERLTNRIKATIE